MLHKLGLNEERIFVVLCPMGTVSLSVSLSVCLSVSQSVCLSVSLSVCLSVFLSVGQCVCLSICQSVCLSFYLSVCLSVCLSLSQTDRLVHVDTKNPPKNIFHLFLHLKSLHELAPEYLSSKFERRETPYNLRDSENKLKVHLPCTNYCKNNFSLASVAPFFGTVFLLT